ncbi:hypothetical protein [Guptibacillus hwajinpoensis]|uniref:SPOR domain-containing protein n=1 Tax=Guptibacillus hwajinpoensis TaxID=208199 RepID=A0A0J6CMR4_9BACL|nr:hypothetical protein [Alkalihalobacillus macyae]KMM37511.1 hypothetical protein AB986_16840 [Alkalihalobacillus macyae]
MDREKRTISIRLNGEDMSKPSKTHKEESAAAEEKDFEWILPERRDAKKMVEIRKRHIQKRPRPLYEPTKRPKLPVGRKKKKSSLLKGKPVITIKKKVVASAIFAIVIGVLFGLSLLMVFSGNNVTLPANSEPTSLPASTTEAELSLDLHVVQSGAYETEDAAKEFQLKFKEEGFPATIFKGEKYYLLIGISPSVEGQDALGSYFESKGQDVYKKVWSVDGKGTSVDPELAQHIQEGRDLLEELTELDLAALSDNKVTTKEIEATAKSIESWSEKGTKMSDWQKDDSLQFTENLNGALKEIQEYTSEEKISSLWIAQQHLLDGMSSYQNVVESMK